MKPFPPTKAPSYWSLSIGNLPIDCHLFLIPVIFVDITFVVSINSQISIIGQHSIYRSYLSLDCPLDSLTSRCNENDTHDYDGWPFSF